MYRINYGNCQVSSSFPSIRMARDYLAKCDGYAYMERREDTGEYFPCNPATGRFLDMTSAKNEDHPAYSGKRSF
jgi:hypothetical protein